MNIEIKLLGPGDETAFDDVAADLFDNPIVPARASEFLNDPRHHFAAAIDGGILVGFVSAVHYVHPDKDPELFVDEVSVSESHRRRGLAKQLMEAIFAVGREKGCTAAWVGTSRSNAAAMRLYESAGGGNAELEDFVMFTFPLK